MRSKLVYAFTVVGLLLGATSAHAKKEYPPPAGVKIATGNFFSVYVLKKEEKPAPANYIARVYEVVIVASTTKHGTQRFTHRVETLDADLLDPKNWEIADLDGDGLDDLHYLAQQTKAGCKVWPAMRWEKDRERFTQGGLQLARHVDAHGKKVSSCALR